MSVIVYTSRIWGLICETLVLVVGEFRLAFPPGLDLGGRGGQVVFAPGVGAVLVYLCLHTIVLDVESVLFVH